MSLRRVHEYWERMAGEDPLWAIASRDEKKGNRWEIEEFFRTGEEDVASILVRLESRGHAIRKGKSLDFGCGVGRLTQALAGRFEEAHGLDISERMIEIARQHNRHGARCAYHASASPVLPFPDGTFDFALSLIVLQHVPPSLAAGYIRELVRVLSPGGVAFFQIPSEPIPPPGREDGLRETVKRVMPAPVLAWIRERKAAASSGDRHEMHGIPRPEVGRIVAASGGRCLEIEPDEMPGEGWTSFCYTVLKESPRA